MIYAEEFENTCIYPYLKIRYRTQAKYKKNVKSTVNIPLPDNEWWNHVTTIHKMCYVGLFSPYFFTPTPQHD
jgi:hypothetical protein